MFADVTSVDVVDPLTREGHDSKVPWTAFPWFLWSSSRLGIMAEAQMESPDCNTKLIGTGPFEYVSWKFGDKFVAKRNPNYWCKDPKTGAQLPVPRPDHVRPARGRRQAHRSRSRRATSR